MIKMPNILTYLLDIDTIDHIKGHKLPWDKRKYIYKLVSSRKTSFLPPKLSANITKTLVCSKILENQVIQDRFFFGGMLRKICSHADEYKIIELTSVGIQDQIKSTDFKSKKDAKSDLIKLSENNRRTFQAI